jgi:hypothetical protein
MDLQYHIDIAWIQLGYIYSGFTAEEERIMAKVKHNILTQGLSGRVGDKLVFRQMRDGRTIVCARPGFSNRVWSEDQLTHHNRFRQAAAYARAASKTNPLYTELARGTAKNAYNIALSDWFNPPVIHTMDRQGGRIRVEATDNVLVDKVQVTILDEEGKTLEQGQAVHTGGSWWEYVTATEGRVRVEAWDLAGNVTKQEAAF